MRTKILLYQPKEEQRRRELKKWEKKKRFLDELQARQERGEHLSGEEVSYIASDENSTQGCKLFSETIHECFQ